MRERLRALAPLASAVLLAIVLVAVAGCAGQVGQQEEQGGQEQQDQSLQLGTVEDWARSGHARPVTFAAQEEGCKNCHDGLAFSETGGGFQPRMSATEGTATGGTEESTGTAGSEEETATRDWVVATDCRACHTGAGVEIADEGSVDGIPQLETAEGGTGALCMACHNGWHQAGVRQEGELGAPHSSVQTDMLFGVNTVPVPNQSVEDSESPHAKVDDTCVGCHVSGGDDPNHLFTIEDFEGCQREGCHDEDMTEGGEASEDFDGDGTTERYQVEVEGLLETLQAEINRAAGSTSFADEGGNVVFEGATVRPDDPAYAAAYNYFFVEFDSSRGVHNPEFTVSLLQSSIESLGGGGAGGSSETTGSETTTP